jgi:ABC-type multidrug transport system permease subunit
MFKIAWNDLRLTFSDRAAVVWMVILPIVFATFFGLVMGGDNANPADAAAALTLVDDDGGAVARYFISDLEGQGLALDLVTADEAATLENKVRTLVIPSGFTADVVAGSQVILHLETDPGASQEASLLGRARIVRAISRTIGHLIARSATDGAVSPESFDDVAAVPDLVRVESRYAGRSEVVPSGFSQSIPGNAVMFVMLIALTYGAATLTGERSAGLLHRLATTPLSRREIILGKILGRLVIASVQVTILVAVALVAHLAFDVVIGNVVNLWVVLLVYAMCVAPLGVIFGAWFEEPDRAANIGVIATIVMAALGGCWWPLEIVPKSMQQLALVLPTTWAMRALHGVVSFGRGLPELATPLAVLAAFAIGFTLIAVRSLRID